jgi:hypothetical protein
MRFITWNASMRFRDKIDNIFPFNADILVSRNVKLQKNGEGKIIIRILINFSGLVTI